VRNVIVAVFPWVNFVCIMYDMENVCRLRFAEYDVIDVLFKSEFYSPWVWPIYGRLHCGISAGKCQYMTALVLWIQMPIMLWMVLLV
jgi:hypothetical protein